MLLAYFRGQRKLLVLLALFTVIFLAVFSLYELPVEAVVYAAALCLAVGLVLFLWSFSRFVRRRRELLGLRKQAAEAELPLPPAADALEEAYQDLLRAVCARRSALEAEKETRLEDMNEYYTLWAHQIKTPIAAMDLLLQEETPGRTELGAELLKINQYVEMALGYLRLDSDSSDYVLREFDLDEVLRQALRKYAKLFILKGIRLEFTQTEKRVLSDEKWLAFVVEQLLSNALKYTPAGGTIRLYGDRDTLVIADSGMGIRPEDLPRVFEKGFTGFNGREDKKSTGIGLYLCRRVTERLGHALTLRSRPGQGTLARLDFSQRPLETE